MSNERTIFSGEFGEILIPDLLTFLDMLGKTGRLELRRGDITKRIHWSSGEIIFADSTDPREGIGEYLVLNGWVTREALDSARSRAKNGADLVKNLIRDGALRPDLLPKSERSLVLDIIYSIFEWRDGTFEFVLTTEPHPERVVLRTSVSNIIMEGSRRLDEWKRIRDCFTSDTARPRRAAGDAAAALQMPPIELDVLSQVDGRRTITDIVRAVEHDRFTVLNALLTLHSAGAIEFSPETEDRTEPELDAFPVAEHGQAGETLQAFNNIFENLLERIRRIKGEEGARKFLATLDQPSFQRGGPLAGVRFTPAGRLAPQPVLANLEGLPADERITKLKGALDRLLAKQVLMLDTSYPAPEKQAISELIAREKGRLGQLDAASR